MERVQLQIERTAATAELSHFADKVAQQAHARRVRVT